MTKLNHISGSKHKQACNCRISCYLITLMIIFLSASGLFAQNSVKNYGLNNNNPILYPAAAKKQAINNALAAEGATTTAQDYNAPGQKTVTNIGEAAGDLQMEAVGDTFGSRITEKMKSKYLTNKEADKAPVFGENLFYSSNTLPFIPIHNPEYIISNGDMISISTWGELKVNGVFQIDSQGNILLPKIDPIHLSGVLNKKLNMVIKQAIKTEFKNNVKIYANLVTAQRIKVFVSGYVLKPGIYAGISSNSVLSFLKQAGGIILNQGSFRDIKMVRNGKTFAKVDLYDFIRNGKLPYIQLQQMDSIVVGPLKGSIEITGRVLRPARFEPDSDGKSLKKLIDIAGLKADATKILIHDDTGLTPRQYYISLNEISEYKATFGMTVTAVSDQNYNLVRAIITGAVNSPHQIIVPRGTTLQEVMEQHINIKPRASDENTRIFRKSIALKQKASIEASLDMLERDIYLTSPLTAEGATIQTVFANNVSNFVSKARQVEPKGQLIIHSPKDWKHINLEDEDVINVPYYSKTVRIDGAVVSPTALIYKPDWKLVDYIKATGGYINVADSSKIIIVSLSGAIKDNTSLAWYNFWTSVPAIEPGDYIMVLPGTSTQALTVVSAIAQVIYQVAVGARVIMPGL